MSCYKDWKFMLNGIALGILSVIIVCGITSCRKDDDNRGKAPVSDDSFTYGSANTGDISIGNDEFIIVPNDAKVKKVEGLSPSSASKGYLRKNSDGSYTFVYTGDYTRSMLNEYVDIEYLDSDDNLKEYKLSLFADPLHFRKNWHMVNNGTVNNETAYTVKYGIDLLFRKGDSFIMAFIDEIKAKAKANKKVIVLPESEDERTYRAAAAVLAEDIANIVIIGNVDDVNGKAAQYGVDISKATVIDPATSDKLPAYIDKLVELRQKKGMTPEQAKDILLNQYIYYGVMMVKMKDADGLVSGACHSTANTLRPCLQILKTAPGTKLVSAFFLMNVPDCEYGENGTFVFADCGLNQNPTSEELAEIAASSAVSFKSLTGKEPRVAMLSYSTMGSAKHDDVSKVQEAVRIAKENHPEICLDGEMQLDAAIVESVGSSKAPGSPVAGKANVLIFPNLDSGNIGYKLVQRLAKAEAYGPMTQGIAAPVNDLSRGCSWEDIVGVVAITAVQCQMQD